MQALLVVGIVAAVACLNYALRVVPALLMISVTLMTCALLPVPRAAGAGKGGR